MSTLTYKPAFIQLLNDTNNILPQGIIVLPNVIPPDPPVPPTPVYPLININNQCCGTIYNKVSNKVVNSNTADLLNGLYVSENTVSIPQNLTSINLLNLKRYASGTTTNLAINDNKLSLTTDVYIYFWLYVIYSDSFVKPITILTKGSNNSYGEYTIQILPNRTLSFYYTLNGTMNVVRSNSIIPERSLIYISIIKKSNSVSIYLNNKVDNSQTLVGTSSATTNPVLIGSGYNSIPFNGFIDNLMISTYPLDGVAYVDKYYTYKPDSIPYQFSFGIITYNGYNVASNISGVQPSNLDTAKLICTQLQNYSQGFSLSSTNNYLYYFTSSGGLESPGGTIYEKISTLNIANNFFTKLFIQTFISNNVSFGDSTLMDGYVKGYNGEAYYFIDGIVYEYDTTSGNFIIAPLDEYRAYYILAAISQIVAFRFAFGRYQYYSFIKETKENILGQNNRLVRKLLHYTLGGTNTLVDFSGQSNSGTWRFYSDIQYLSVDNSVGYRSNQDSIEEGINGELYINKALEFSDNKDTSSVVKIVRDVSHIKSDSNIFIYIGQNIIPLVNTPSDVFVNNLPVLECTIPFYLELDKEIDIVEQLIAMNISLGRLICICTKIDISPGMYNVSIISNSQTRITVANKEHHINNNSLQHIIFHNSKQCLEIEIQFYYSKLNQVAKFILIQP